MTKKEYIKPFIKRQTAGVMNKYGVSYNKGYRTDIEGVAIDDLTKQFGSPLFVLSENILRKKYREAYALFSSRYPKVQFSWSYKTNYLDAVCSVFHQEGEIAEVVSEFEYQKARRLGVPGSKIIYNGPYKPLESLLVAFREDAIVNIDNMDEIYKAEEAAIKLNKKVKVGLRMNMDTGIYPQWSRFGFNLENGSFYTAVKRIARSQWLSLNGIHAHIGTFIMEPKAYATASKKMIEMMRKIKKEFEINIEYIDLGGGFPSMNRLKGSYLPPEVSIPNISEYAEAICDTFLEELNPDEYPLLYLETGRALVDEAGYLITTIDSVKRLPDGTRSYIIDAGVNILYTSYWYNYKVEIDRQVYGGYESSVVYGPLCMNIDVVLENVSLPMLNKGTRLILSPMGAYNITQSMQFIRYRPAVVLIMEDGSVEVIREADTLEDIVSREKIPAKLKNLNL